MAPPDETCHIPAPVTGVHTEILARDEPFMDMAARFASEPGTVALVSGGNGDCAAHHILGVRPFLTFSGRGRRMSVQTQFQNQDRIQTFDADPFETLRSLVSGLKIHSPGPGPIQCGLMGYLAYDLKDALEELPATSVDDLGLPHILFFAPSLIVTHDIAQNISRVHAPVLDLPGLDDPHDRVRRFKDILSKPARRDPGFSGSGEFSSNFEKPDYLQAIRDIREYIAAGHVYQINMSQRFQMGFTGDGFSLFRALFRMNPAPFFAYVNAGDHQAVSTSPERFIKQEGRALETRPIKGTRPRGKTPDEDEALKGELEKSPKDDAELSMIVDLLRNDMGKVCEAGSVRVAAHKRLEPYDNVWHLVSVIEGTLDASFDSVDVLKAVFPGGSITGCPKIRAMEIIDELEPCRRHLYTGSIGYISSHETMDFSIAIRTATLINDRIVFSVGGGVVYDSDPQSEYEETLHKGKTLMEAFPKKNGDTSPVPWVWMNGVLKPAARAALSVFDPGLLFGHGFFETIKVEKAEPENLNAHIARFNRAWAEFFPGEAPPDISWDIIIDRVIEKNGLKNRTAAVKILATKGRREFAPHNHGLVVSARPYVHRLEEIGKKGLDLLTYPHPRLTPLAAHKTLNHLYYIRAGQWAREKGGDEALILNPDGTVSETHSGNILLVKGNKIIRPQSPFALPGTMQRAVADDFSKKGFEIETSPVRPEALFEADGVWVTNSLMGAVDALGLDGRGFGSTGLFSEAAIR
ncbi:Aminodeoxychorismate synthase, component I [Candidatus Desulfarcum epimagneticum]|uniref:aminodeoxychorismate synthase n=1 Tax=uncultured Desulfobacteraceae bacterium TaxID=218296 RepID=A0A484HIX8_9BACT|nr:Aminodeoxychorismate synthase, component I [uncultured Desulfobacteraceae bacterium]